MQTQEKTQADTKDAARIKKLATAIKDQEENEKGESKKQHEASPDLLITVIRDMEPKNQEVTATLMAQTREHNSKDARCINTIGK